MVKKLRLDADRAAVQKRMEAGEEMDTFAVWKATETGSKKWANDTLRNWHREGKVYISKWVRGMSGPPAPFYRWGKGKDAARPAPLGNSAKNRKWRKNNPEKVAAANARAAMRRRKTPLLDPINAAMLGYVWHGNAWIKKNEQKTYANEAAQ